MSYVRRPSRRASVPSYAAPTCAPATSSSRGACQPPNGNPTGSSSGPPGDCPTRSRVANSSMWMRPMTAPDALVVPVERWTWGRRQTHRCDGKQLLGGVAGGRREGDDHEDDHQDVDRGDD